MTPTIRVGEKNTQANKPDPKNGLKTAVKARWEEMLWDEVILLSIRQHDRKGQLAPVEQQVGPA